jgi:peroxiredoxin
VIIFFNPQCGFCMQMVDDLAEIENDGAVGRPLPLVVTTGGIDANREALVEAGVRCPILIEDKRDVMTKYQTQGTPTGYLIDASGKIASPLTVGAVALLNLINPPAPAAPPGKVLAGANGRKNGEQVKDGHHGKDGHHRSAQGGKTNRGIEHSKINRNGLKAGTPAPPFRLPRLDGTELGLEDFRGRRVLLVFSDPECGPCEHTALQLEQLQKRRPDLQVLMISRRDPELNRQKFASLKVSYPVVLQKQWEISRKYAMFATPIAYLIDEQGVLLRDVAVGVELILGLADVAVEAPPASAILPSS